jgi:WD40 repeat protein/serine/threonine protein kinase/tetratricopeptide (TPR) repeat protein
MSEHSADRDPVEELAEEFAARHRRGERPALSEYVMRYPQWADQIRDLFPALVVMERLKPVPGEATGDYQGGPLHPSGRALERLGDYRILREVGRGGMGIVYEAEQESLGRHVALKVLPTHALLDGLQLHRFRREARSAARLHHTNIVPVYGVGEHNGLHYYVMQFIQGLGLDAVLAELQHVPRPGGRRGAGVTVAAGYAKATRAGDVSAADMARSFLTGAFAASDALPGEAGDSTPVPKNRSADTQAEATPAKNDSSAVHLPGQPEHSTLSDSGRHYWQSIARIGLQVAEALAYAHAQGTLHRDIKPSNLLVDTHGTVWVTDFGLAKAVADEENLTHTGDLVGTLRYMSPERFQGHADARADIYGLGLTLYELLVLRPVFEESDRNRLIHQITHAEPPPPRKLNRQVPRDLETIVLKAIARDPAHRYQAATELAEDLKRFLEDKPIRARRVSRVEQLWRWCRRNPAVASLAATAALLLITVGVVAGVAYIQTTMAWEGRDQAKQAARLALVEKVQAEQAARTAEEARRDAERKAAEAKKQYTSYFTNLAGDYLERGRKLALGGEIGPALLFMAKGLDVVPAHEKDLQTVIRINLAAWARRRPGYSLSPETWAGPMVQLRGEFSTERQDALGRGPVLEDSAGLYVGHREHPVPARVEPVLQTRATNGVGTVAFSPDGKTLLTRGATGIWLWDVSTRRVLRSITWNGGDLSFARFSANGKVIVAGGQQQTQFWDATTAKPLGAPIRFQNSAGWVIPNPNGEMLLKGEWNSGRGRNEVQLFTLKDKAPVGDPIPTPVAVNLYVQGDMNVLFSPDGKYLVTKERLQGQAALVQAASMPEELRIWDTATGKPLGKPLGPFYALSAVAFSSGGKMLLATQWNRNLDHFEIQRWDVETGKPVGAIPLGQAPALVLAVGPDGKTVAVMNPQEIRLFDALTGRRLGQALRLPAMFTAVAFSPDGKLLLTGSNDQTARLWNAATGARLGEPLRHGSPVRAVAFSPDGRTALTQGMDNTVSLWDLTVRLGTPLRHSGKVNAVAFSPKGDLCVLGGADGTVRLWDPAKHRPVGKPLHHPGPVHAAVFSPDGKLLLTGCAPNPTGALPGEGEARLWEVATGKLHRVFPQRGSVLAVALSPDGKWIVTGGKSSIAQVWNAATGQLVGKPLVHPRSPVFAVSFHPDGKTVVTGCEDGNARRWDPATGKAIGKPLAHHGPIYTLAFSPDGKVLFTGGENLKAGTGEGRFWDAAIWKPLGEPVLNHSDPFLQAAFSPDGRTLLTSGGNWQRKRGNAQLWNVATRKPLVSPLVHLARVSAAAFSADGKAVLTGCDDQTARLWSLAKPEQGTPERVRLWAEAMTGLRLDQDNRAVALTPQEQAARSWRLQLLDTPGDSAESFARRGQAYSHLGAWEKAAAEYAKAIRLRPRDAQLRVDRAKVFIRAKQWAQAVRDFSAALALEPKHPRLWTLRGRVYGHLRRWDRAADDFTRAVRLRPDDPWLCAERGRALVQAGRCKGAAADFAKALALLPDGDPERERIYKDLVGSDRTFARVAELRPRDTRLWLTRIRGRSKDDLRTLVQDLSAALKPLPHDGVLRLERGQAYAQSGDWSRAAADFAKALEALPDGSKEHAALCAQLTKWQGAFPQLLALRSQDAQLWIARGREHLGHSQCAKAAADFIKAMDLLHAKAPDRCRQLRYEICRSDEACAQALALRPKDAELWDARGRACALRNEWKQAATYFKKAAELRPNDVRPWHQEACALLHSGAVGDYRRLCARLLKRHGNTADPNVAYWLARTCVLAPNAVTDQAKVVTLAERIGAARDGLPLSSRVLGPAYYRAGRFKDAVGQLYENFVEGRPGDPAAATLDWLWLALAQERRGQATKARQHLARFEQLAREFGASDPTASRPVVLSWEDWLEYGFLRAEAAEQINPEQVYRDRARDFTQQREWDKAADALTQAIARQPGDAALYVERGRDYARLSQWAKARADYAKAVASRPVHDDWFELACLHLITGDERAYRRMTARMARDFGQTRDAFTAYVAARIAALAPESGVDSALAVRWANQAVADSPKAWYLHCLGLAYYRAGQTEAAIRQFEASLKAQVNWSGKMLNWLGLALAHHALGHNKEARRWLAMATDWLDHSTKGKEGPASIIPPPDWLEYQILRRETETQLKDKPAGPKKK